MVLAIDFSSPALSHASLQPSPGELGGQSRAPSSEARTEVPRLLGTQVATDAIETAYATSYVWAYEAERDDLRRLYEKAKESQWNAATYLAWDTPVDPQAENVADQLIPIFGTPMWQKLDPKREIPLLRQHATSYLLSNFLHGEQGALLASSQIVCAVPSADAKLYAATQVIDEARHVEAYDRYLREKVELSYPISPHLRQLLDEILQERRWDMKYLGMQILVEGLALAAFGLIAQTANEPLIKQIVRMIVQDEARHVAFGVLSLEGIYTQMSESELRDREDFVIEASRLMRDRFLMQEVWQNLGLPVDECLAAVKTSPIMQTFQSLLFSKIVPNTKRLGLLTPRVRRGFEELGVIQYESWDATV
jgi:hypothetical protein